MTNGKAGRRALRLGGLAAGVLATALCGAARADEAREKALEDRVKQLEDQLGQVLEQMRDGGVNHAGDELSARVDELEKLAKVGKDGMFGYWKGGTKWDAADGRFKTQLYGRLQNDWIWWDSHDEVETALGDELNTGTEFRRARLGVRGTLYGNVEYKAEFDFAGGEAGFADVYMQLNGIFCDLADVRVGHFKEPFGLDELTSSRFSTFMERNTISQGGFAPARNTGIQFSGDAMGEELTWAFGMFRNADDFGDDTGNTQQGEYNFTARVAGRPYVSEDKSQYLHLGVAGSLRKYSDEMARYRARPEVHMSPRFVDTGSFDAEDGTHLGLEAAFVSGPFSAQAEYARADVDAISMSDPAFDAFSAEVAYFLTGGTKGYKEGAFDRPKLKNIYGDEGMGEVELALRFSTIDLNDGDVAGGEMDIWTFGVNWWLNPHTKVQLNVQRIDAEDLGQKVNAVGMRFQVDF